MRTFRRYGESEVRCCHITLRTTKTLREKAFAYAQESEMSLSEVVEEALIDYLRRKKK